MFQIQSQKGQKSQFPLLTSLQNLLYLSTGDDQLFQSCFLNIQNQLPYEYWINGLPIVTIEDNLKLLLLFTIKYIKELSEDKDYLNNLYLTVDVSNIKEQNLQQQQINNNREEIDEGVIVFKFAYNLDDSSPIRQKNKSIYSNGLMRQKTYTLAKQIQAQDQQQSKANTPQKQNKKYSFNEKSLKRGSNPNNNFLGCNQLKKGMGEENKNNNDDLLQKEKKMLQEHYYLSIAQISLKIIGPTDKIDLNIEQNKITLSFSIYRDLRILDFVQQFQKQNTKQNRGSISPNQRKSQITNNDISIEQTDFSQNKQKNFNNLNDCSFENQLSQNSIQNNSDNGSTNYNNNKISTPQKQSKMQTIFKENQILGDILSDYAKQQSPTIQKNGCIEINQQDTHNLKILVQCSDEIQKNTDETLETTLQKVQNKELTQIFDTSEIPFIHFNEKEQKDKNLQELESGSYGLRKNSNYAIFFQEDSLQENWDLNFEIKQEEGKSQEICSQQFNKLISTNLNIKNK